MQQSGVLVEVPFLQLGILLHVSQCMRFFSSQVQRHVEVVRPALAISITTDGGSQNGDEVSLLSALHGLVSMEEL